jgi:hypothetical protein
MTEEAFRVAPQEFDAKIPLDQMRPHPENYNQGDVGAICESLDSHGFYGAVIVQRATGNILAGNHRYFAAQAKGAKTLPGFWLDVDDEDAKRILAVDNRTAKLATVDESKLVQLLASVFSTPKGLAGTGYDGDDLDDLVQQLQPPDLGKLGGGGGPSEGDLWPVLRFKVSPETRDKFYAATDDAEDKTDTGRFAYLLDWTNPVNDA